MPRDEDIFEQIDRLERGARDVGALHEPSQIDSGGIAMNDGYGTRSRVQPPYENSYHMVDEYLEPPFQLDAFDEQLLRQPDRDSRQWQAAQGHARLSLRPAASQVADRAYAIEHNSHPSAPLVPHAGLAQYTYSPPREGGPSTSPVHSAYLSSPAFNASQRHHAAPAHRRLEIQQQYQHDAHETGFNDAPMEQATNSRTHLARDTPERRSQVNVCQQRPIAATRTAQPRPIPAARITDGGTPVVQGIPLIPTRQLPDRFRAVFSFPLFNAVQSKCFSVVFQSNDNFVLSSPTGSGKTAMFELAICRLVHGYTIGSFKIVYMAPTKSLCAERVRDWQAKFSTFDLQCAELTGDTDNAQLRNVQHASIIITTPEKWDSVTRKWKDHQKLMQMVKLFLIDEVHIVKEDRGPTLEAVVSRMKSVDSDVRFIALSATVPNSQDIATWLGKDYLHPDVPAPREKFGEEFRPVRLQKHVCGYKSDSNDFAFEKLLDGRLPDVIVRWSQRKPIMVFCMTRKSCVTTAQLLANWWSSKGPKDRYWPAPSRRVVVGDNDLRGTTTSGVAFHHAGLHNDDRVAVEKAYLLGELSVICCTSTLAVGVNLPCHMVIIKGTVSYQTTGSKEYSDLETMQMLGRAGRPQFDDSAVAVIMTRLHRVKFYENMIAGSEVLESCLHQHLIDHLNAEIGLGTITNAASAKKWLMGTFLYVRLKDNPEHYRLDGESQGRTLDERLEHICKKAIALLEEHDLVKGTIKLQCTEFGDSMARYYIQFDTMKRFLALPPKAKISEILSTICQAAEFRDVRFRAGEKPIYKELNKNPSMKFPIPVNIDIPAHKVSLIIQSVLGAIDVNTENYQHRQEYNTSRAIIFQHAHRLIRCIIDCQLYLDDATSARNALMLARSLSAQVWDDSPLHIRQIEGIGPVGVRKLVAAGVKSIEDLATMEPARIETALTRNPPHGTTVKNKAAAFPQLRVSLKGIGEPMVQKGEGVMLRVKAEIGFLNEKVPETFNHKAVYVCFLAETSDGRKAHFARVSAKKLGKGEEVLFSAKLTNHGQVIRGYLMCDEVAGTQRMAMLKPNLPAFMFPVAKPGAEQPQIAPGHINAPNTSKHRAAAGTQARPDEMFDEFGDASIDDSTLAALEFTNIDDFDDDGNHKSTQKKPITSRKPAAQPRNPVQLPNGRWACNHVCKDKTTCKHGACCREGLEKKPRPPKPKDSKKSEPASDPRQTQLDLSKTKVTNSCASSQAPPGRNTVHSQKAKDLESLHNSVNASTQDIQLLGRSSKRGSGAAQNVQTAPSGARFDDFSLDALESDDFPTDPFHSKTRTPPILSPHHEPLSVHDGDEDMLDMPDFYDGIHADDDGLLNFAAQTDPLDVDTGQVGDDSASSLTHGAPNHLIGPLVPASEDHAPAEGVSRQKGLFITDTSTDNLDDINDDFASISGALPDNMPRVDPPAQPHLVKSSKHLLEDTAPTDASQFMRPSNKHQKLPSRNPSGLELESTSRHHQQETELSIDDNAFLAEVAGLTGGDGALDTTAQQTPQKISEAFDNTSRDHEKQAKDQTEPLEDWLARVFGLDHFQLV